MSDQNIPRATQVLRAGHWVARTARGTVTLDYDDRHRRRRRFVADNGLAFLLDLEEATVLRDGDGLLLEGGGVVAVRSAPEALVEVRADDARHLMRLAWHIGNRHLPAQLDAERILIRDDHVIVAMLRGLGARAEVVRAPFDPEGGAYGEHNRYAHQHFAELVHAHDHGHDHGDDCGCGHDHGHDHGHGHHH